MRSPQTSALPADRAGEPLVEMRDIVKKYGDTVVLQGVDLEVDRGEVVVLIGPSGAGKSTLLRCINGLERRNDRKPVLQIIDGPGRPLAQALRRRVRIQCDHQAGAKGSRSRKVGDVAAMQDVEHAVREYQRAQQPRQPLLKIPGSRIFPWNGGALTRLSFAAWVPRPALWGAAGRPRRSPGNIRRS